jgi:L-iditol 2-dehydrogenase
MIALKLYEKNNLKVENVEKPEPGPFEAILKVKSTSICATDIKAYFYGGRTKLPIILGHEFAGDIYEVGKGLEDYLGQRVTVNPNIFCGKCEYCLMGEHVLCPNRYAIGIDIDGSFSEYLKIPAQAFNVGCVQRIPPDLSYEEAALVEPLSCCFRGQNKIGVKPGDFVTIIGSGPIGLMHLKIAKFFNVSKVIISEVDEKRAKIAEEMNADYVVNPLKEDLEKKILELTDGRGSDVVIVAVGSPKAQQDALRIVRRGGKINFFAGLPSKEAVPLDTNIIHYKQLTVLGTSMSTPYEFKKTLDIVSSKLIDVKPLITHKLKLIEGLKGFEMATKLESLKVMLYP